MNAQYHQLHSKLKRKRKGGGQQAGNIPSLEEANIEADIYDHGVALKTKHYFVKDDLESGVEEPRGGRGGTSRIGLHNPLHNFSRYPWSQ